MKQDDKESLEVAVQCIGEAFGVDPSDSNQVAKLSIKPAKLQTIFDVAVNARMKMGSTPSAAAAPASSAPSAAPATTNVSDADKAKAEASKVKGNSLMSAKSYDQAIQAYTEAIAIDGTNPVYYSNRAAAHASKGDHDAAVEDAEKAIEVDSKFVKAYSRLG